MPGGGPWDTGSGTYPSYPTTIPPGCSHGVGWANPCAACGRGYPSSTPSVTLVDLSPVTAALARIEVLLLRLVGQDTGKAEDDGSS